VGREGDAFHQAAGHLHGLPFEPHVGKAVLGATERVADLMVFHGTAREVEALVVLAVGGLVRREGRGLRHVQHVGDPAGGEGHGMDAQPLDAGVDVAENLLDPLP